MDSILAKSKYSANLLKWFPFNWTLTRAYQYDLYFSGLVENAIAMHVISDGQL